MISKRVVALLPLVVLLGSNQTEARQERCMVRVVKATGATEDPSSVMKPGEIFGPITALRVDKSNGRISYCAHGSYRYPSTNLDFVSPCRIESFSDYEDKEERSYSPK